MSVAKKLIDGMSKKDADQIEKFVTKVLDMSVEYWADETNKRFKESGLPNEGDEEETEETRAYHAAFQNWHALRQTQNGFKAWLDPTKKLPGEDE